MKPTFSTFSTRMADALAESGLSGRRLAQLARTTPGQVSQWLRGQVKVENIKADVLERISQALGVRPRWLLYGELPKYLSDPEVAEPASTYQIRSANAGTMWQAYLTAPTTTRAAVDILLLSPAVRNSLCREFPLLGAGMSLLEQWAEMALSSRKSA